MAKLALLIGSPVGELAGVETDVRKMDEILASYGFAVRKCVGVAATRAGILDAYTSLIDDVSSGDAALVYYSGHGARGAAPQVGADDAAGEPISTYHQFIVPMDIDESTGDDFRGITNLELSLRMARLTEKTRNVTVILDCCHAARMSRSWQLTSRALPRVWYLGVGSHLKRLKSQGIDASRLDIESNPHAVRLVAAGPNQSAYEYTNPGGQTIGMLTESLRIALAEAASLPVTWNAVGQRVRNRVISLEHTQRPDLEGPADRLLFDVRTVEQTGVLGLAHEDGKPILLGGRILGVEIGDQYAIVPLGQHKPDPKHDVATATVRGVAGGKSRITLKFHGGHNSIPDGARAFPIRRALHKLAIRVRGDDDQAAGLRESIERSSHFRLISGDDPTRALAELDVSGDKIVLRDAEQRPLVAPKPLDDASLRETQSNLEQIAQAHHLRTLSSGEGPFELDKAFDIDWGIVKEGQRCPLQETGELLRVGEPVYVRVANNSEKTIYASILDIGLGGKITLLNASEPSGVEIEANEEYILGYREYYGLEGLVLQWADAIPEDGPRPESLVVIVSDRPQNLRVFEQRGMRSLGGAATSHLRELLTQFARGGMRELATDTGAVDVRYAVRHIDFLLDPNHQTRDAGPEFLIDERPEPGFLVRAHRGAAVPPDNVAVRLSETVVHRNRALFSTEVRIDSMVITGAGETAECYRAHTAHFPGVKDGDRLSFDNLLVYRGPVRGFLDIAVWISRDRQGSLALSDMLQSQLNSEEFKNAALALAGLAVAAPHAAAIVAATGAAATLTSIGYRLLSQAVGNSIGLYRTSFLGHERFGLGRHPKQGLMRAQDFSFGYEIIEA